MILVAAVVFTGADTSVLGYDQLDRQTADAGASLALASFFSRHSDAQERLVQAIEKICAIAPEEDESANESEWTQEEIEYGEAKEGVVCVDGAVNVRKSTTTLSPIVAQRYMEQDIKVLGEKIANGNLWYHVQVEDAVGYVLGKFILFGDDAKQFFIDLAESKRTSRHLPESFVIPSETLEGLPEEVVNELKDCAGQVQYCIKYDYPEAEENQYYLSMYSILAYMIENLERIRDIALENRLGELYNTALADINGCNHARENLKEITNRTDEEFESKIREAIKERQEQERLTLGEEIVNYAASFVGSLPYIWGGTSLTSGADCSGFLGQIYAHFGLLDQATANAHGYTSSNMRNLGYAVSVHDIQPGDLLCYNGHVAIYYGNGVAVHEPSPGKKAQFGDMYMLPIITVRRLIP